MNSRTAISGVLVCFLVHLCIQGTTNGAPIKRSVDSDLKSRVESALNNTLSLSVLDSEANRSILVMNIVQELKAGGFDKQCSNKCKQRSKTFIVERFLQFQGPGCLTLQEISLTSIEPDLTIYALGKSKDSLCQAVRFDPECLPEQYNGPLACTATTNLAQIPGLTENHFPRFMMDVECGVSPQSSCVSADKLLRYYPLVRSEECDGEGYERWEQDTSQGRLSMNAGCDCTLADY